MLTCTLSEEGSQARPRIEGVNIDFLNQFRASGLLESWTAPDEPDRAILCYLSVLFLHFKNSYLGERCCFAVKLHKCLWAAKLNLTFHFGMEVSR